MKEKDSNPQIIVKIVIIDVFPSIEEINNNNTEVITISFQNNDKDLIFNLSDLLLYKKEIELSYPKKLTNIKMMIYKNNILYAFGFIPIKNNDQWITMSYENKKREGNSNLAFNLMDCIKIKISCKIILKNEFINIIETSINNMPKKNTVILNQKNKALSKKKINLNQMFQDSINTDENRKSNRYADTNMKISSPNSYTTINKNNNKKIELSGTRSNNFNNKKINFDYTNIKNDLRNISLSIHSNSKKSLKIIGKKNVDGEPPVLTTEIKPFKKDGALKRKYEELSQLNLISKKNNKNKSYNKMRIDVNTSNKNIKKRKSGGICQVNLMGNLYKTTTGNFIQKEEKNRRNKKEKNNYIKKSHASDNILMNSNNEQEIRNLTCSSEIYENNGKLLNLVNENIQNNNDNLDNNDIIINHDIENIQDDDILFKNNNIKDNKFINNNMIILNEEDMEDDIFYKQLEDFKLLYSDEYIKSINNDYMKLEIELFIEKVIELNSLYNNQIEEKNLEYQINLNSYYKNVSQLITMEKLYNKLNIIKSQFQLKKYNLKDIKSANFNNSINNLITNEQQIKIFKNNFIDEIQRKINYKKEILKYIIVKLIENEKNKNILNKNVRYQIWIKNNYIDKKKKEKNMKSQKHNSKKKLNINLNNSNSSNNKKLHQIQTVYGKTKDNKINEDKRKNKSKK